MKRTFKRKLSYDYKLRMLLATVFGVFALLAYEYEAYGFVFVTGFAALIFIFMTLSMTNEEKYK